MPDSIIIRFSVPPPTPGPPVRGAGRGRVADLGVDTVGDARGVEELSLNFVSSLLRSLTLEQRFLTPPLFCGYVCWMENSSTTS
ncbi:unnamed protein product [Pleuronectes platessa]|uniref:Uncharacterized protein n=1 Tax=Pleuronectes platessa TaxID=8262 RepID=A0A9N7U0G2_PLEPL|nr:unnamed protein product [Pleuronectes platessa]